MYLCLNINASLVLYNCSLTESLIAIVRPSNYFTIVCVSDKTTINVNFFIEIHCMFYMHYSFQTKRKTCNSSSKIFPYVTLASVPQFVGSISPLPRSIPHFLLALHPQGILVDEDNMI